MSADEAEVDRMIEAGAVDPNATRSALALMATRYLTEEIRKRERRAARADETIASARRERASSAVVERAQRIAATIAERASTDWTKLLDATFALPSGKRVSWATATVEQHEARAAALEVMAAGDLQTAALHREAVADITRVGVHTLGAVMAKPFDLAKLSA